MDLLKVLCARLESGEVKTYFDIMLASFENPQIDDVFGKAAKEEETKKENSDSEENHGGDDDYKADVIRTFALN